MKSTALTLILALVSSVSLAEVAEISVSEDCQATNEKTSCVASGNDFIKWMRDLPEEKTAVRAAFGKGEFDLTSYSSFCTNQKNIEIVGAGINQTILSGTVPVFNGPVSHISAVLNLEDCDNIAMSNLTIRSDSVVEEPHVNSTSTAGVVWFSEEGQSIWENISFTSGDYAWVSNGGMHAFKNTDFRVQSKFSVSMTSQKRDGLVGIWANEGTLDIKDSTVSVSHNEKRPVNGAIGVFNFGSKINIESTNVIVTIDTDSPFDTPEFGGVAVYSDYNGKSKVTSSRLLVNAKNAGESQDIIGTWIGGYADGYKDELTLTETKVELIPATKGKANPSRKTKTASLVTY